MKRSLALLCLLAWYAAPGTSLLRGDTFGEWSTPVNAGGRVNTEYNDMYAVLSRDGLTMYFTSDRPGGVGGDDLWFAKRLSLDAPWGEPTNMGAPINTIAADSLALLSSDEHVMFFHSTRAGGCGAGDIWTTRRQSTRSEDWEPPVNVGCVVNTAATEIAPAFFENPETGEVTLFYGSNRPGSQDFDVYASAVGEDGYFGPGALVPELSSNARDTRTFFRKDGLEAFVTSDRAGGVGLDIWVSTREALSDSWSTPANLGSPVNSEFADGSPWLSKDGTTLYLFSTRTGGYGGRDIWYTTRVKIAGE
jgi:WD40-like Beta Propeller Repeat